MYNGQELDVFGRKRKSWTFTSMYMSATDQAITADYQRKEVHIRKARTAGERMTGWTGTNDADCASSVYNVIGTHLRRSGVGVVAGLPVIRWKGGNNSGGEQEFDLAPSLNCAILKRREWVFDESNIPIFISNLEAAAVWFGEPATHLFSLPTDFKIDVENDGGPNLLDRLAEGPLGRELLSTLHR
jgi:hypothetical protein